jgi:gluconokinase
VNAREDLGSMSTTSAIQPVFVVIGVAGCGKSVIGRALATACGVSFVDGDDFHTAANITRMNAGIPLRDEDREEWLQSLAAKLREQRTAGAGVVLACSALKRSYRDLLRASAPALQLVFLTGHSALLRERLAARVGHFMPASLLASQLQTLEPPQPDERAWQFDIALTPEQLVAGILQRHATLTRRHSSTA